MPDSSLLHAPPAEVRLEARLTADQRTRRDAHIQTVHDFQAKSLEAAVALAAIKDEGLYAEDGTFADFTYKHFGIGRSRAYQLAAAGRLHAELDGAGVSPLPKSEAQLRPLTKLGAFTAQRRAWERAVSDAAGAGREADAVTMDDVLAIVRGVLGDTARDHADAAAEELRRVAPDELEAGRMLCRVRESVDAAAFERLLREEVGRSKAWAETTMAYAEACDGLEEGERPTVVEFERFERALRPLAPADRTAVWKRLAARGAGSTLTDAVGEVVAERAGEMGLELASPRGTGLEESACDDSLDAGRPLTAVVDVELLEGDLRTAVEEAGEAIAPHAVLLDYAALPDGVVDAIVDATVTALHAGRDMPADASADRIMLVKGQRRMVRVGFEPDLATWAWPVLVPAPNRFARAWLPLASAESDAESEVEMNAERGAPCFVPRRLLQPTKTKRKALSARDRERREARTYLVDDEERHQSRVVLLAPGVDLTHGAVPDACVRLVLEHAAAAADFVFLAVALDPDRVAALDWPRNVRPVVHATTAERVRRAVAAFAEANAGVGCRGLVVLEGVGDPLAVDDALFDADGRDDEEALDPDLVRDHLAAVLVRGKSTSRDALRSALALRRYGVRVQVGRDVRVREEEAVFDPAEFDAADD